MSHAIGFVGVGRMGANMARRLQETGFVVSAVFDVNREAAESLGAELNCAAAADLKAVTALSGIVITVVSDDKAMKKTFTGGLLTRAKGKLFINCATVTPAIHVWSSKSAKPKARAHSKRAWRRASRRHAKPVLEKLSSALRYIGAAGHAAQVKALVNVVMNANTAALAEGLGLGAALGLDLTMLREVFSQTGARSGVLQTDGEDMQNREHSCFFSAAHAAKDSGIALKLAKDQKLNLPIAAATKKQYDRMIQLGLGELDKSGIAELTFKGRKCGGS